MSGLKSEKSLTDSTEGVEKWVETSRCRVTGSYYSPSLTGFSLTNLSVFL